MSHARYSPGIWFPLAIDNEVEQRKVVDVALRAIKDERRNC
jgi:hypothetical protein